MIKERASSVPVSVARAHKGRGKRTRLGPAWPSELRGTARNELRPSLGLCRMLPGARCEGSIDRRMEDVARVLLRVLTLIARMMPRRFRLLYSHYAIAGASAEFVQIRDIALSGFFFVLYNLGPGARSLDSRRYALPETLGRDWEPLGLLLRLSLGIAFLVGGLFAGYDNVVTWGVPGIVLAVIGAGLIAGVEVRWFALAAAAVLVWFMLVKLAGAAGVIAWFNAVKREFAILAPAGTIAWAGGGRMFTLDKALDAVADWWGIYGGGGRRPVASASPASFRAGASRSGTGSP